MYILCNIYGRKCNVDLHVYLSKFMHYIYCICAYMYVGIYVCMYVSNMYVNLYKFMHAYLYVCMYLISMCIYISFCMYICSVFVGMCLYVSNKYLRLHFIYKYLYLYFLSVRGCVFVAESLWLWLHHLIKCFYHNIVV